MFFSSINSQTIERKNIYPSSSHTFMMLFDLALINVSFLKQGRKYELDMYHVHFFLLIIHVKVNPLEWPGIIHQPIRKVRWEWFGSLNIFLSVVSGHWATIFRYLELLCLILRDNEQWWFWLHYKSIWIIFKELLTFTVTSWQNVRPQGNTSQREKTTT